MDSRENYSYFEGVWFFVFIRINIHSRNERNGKEGNGNEKITFQFIHSASID